MAREIKYYIVAANALPEIFVKVAEAKRMMQTGEADTVGDSAYILKNNEPEEGCPVHQHPQQPEEPDPADPDDPAPPEEGGGAGDGDWFGNLWGGD